jgi:predicted DCC family thiol-disulfide oxidoreductase YuxK
MEISQLPKDKKIILFDGVCNLCDSVVQYVIRQDKKDVFRLDSLQSENGIDILRHIGRDPEKFDSIILYIPGKGHYDKSDAALEIAKDLGWPILAAVLKAVPRFIRNPVYDFVARNRYKWYGKKESCMIPTSEIKSKFL